MLNTVNTGKVNVIKKGELKVGEQIIGYGGYNNKQIQNGDTANSVKYEVTDVTKDDKGPVYIKSTSELLEKLKKGGIRIPSTATSTYLQLSSLDSMDFNLSEEQMDYNNSRVSAIFEKMNKSLIDLKSARTGRDIAILMERLRGIQLSLSAIDLGGNYIYNPASKKMEPFSYEAHKGINPQLKFDKGIDYGYATTIHKSQGLTIENVYFDIKSIEKSRGRTPVMLGDKAVTTEKNALYYVGMSRASNKVVLPAAYDYDVVVPTKVNTDVEVPKNVVSSQKSNTDIVKENIDQIKKDLNLKNNCK